MKKRNYPLLVGGALLLATLLLAVFGPLLAPHDPLETNTVVLVDGVWVSVPYPPFAVPGFPLGSDAQGRDLLSRLLWGVRPTLILVAAAALIRLGIGTIVGMTAGWSSGRTGRVLEWIIAAALTVPTIIMALAVVTAVGIQKGLPAFLLGLCATGWADTARVVGEQTRSLKQQSFVEAARSMGGTGPENVIRHVLRHVTPGLTMLLSFEVGATLMTVAGLGFLGYYVGGAFWVEVLDFQQRTISGMPELGQMLASSWQIFKPWATFATGTVVFVAILGCNLFGEGLRRRLSLGELGQRTAFSATMGRAAAWLEETLLVPSPEADRRRRALGGALVVASIALAVVLWRPWQGSAGAARGSGPSRELPVIGGHQWAAERRDAYGTASVPQSETPSPAVRWVLRDESGFVGGPVIDKDGNVYATAKERRLYAVDRDGTSLWVSQLPAEPVGTPALGPADANGGLGAIYVSDRAGGVSAYTLEGDYLWRVDGSSGRRASSGPIVGPDGVVYFSAVDRVEAVNPDGSHKWMSNRLPGSGEATPRLHPNGQVLFVQDAALDVETGKLLDYNAVVRPGQAGINATYMIGGDGLTYLREAHDILRWESTSDGPQVVGKADWTYQTATVYLPLDSGVSSAGTGVLVYGSAYDDLRVIQLSMDNRLLTNLHWPLRSPRLVATDAADRAYVCGTANAGGAECLAVRPGDSVEPGWRIRLETGGETIGGAALTRGRLYVTVQEGWLYAIGE